MTNATKLITALRTATPTQRWAALAALVGLLLLVPSLPVLVMVPAAAVLIWVSSNPLLLGMVLGAVVLHRHRRRVTK
jgi:hypothetical protein